MVLVANSYDLEPKMVKPVRSLEDVYLYIKWREEELATHHSHMARLAQSVERTPFKRVVVGSSPTSGGGKRRSLGLEPEVSRKWRYQGLYMVKTTATIYFEGYGSSS